MRHHYGAILLLAAACSAPPPTSPVTPTPSSAALPIHSGQPPPVHTDDDHAAAKKCRRLTPDLVTRSLDLGAAFLLNNQREQGNFVYAYDWQTKRIAPGDSQVRQAGASWGLALLHRHRGSPQTLAASRRALAFFARHSNLTSSGERYIDYPGDETGALGTVALVALAHIELLRAGVEDNTLRRHLDEYLRFTRTARLPNGGFHGRYRLSDGKPFGEPSPYFDGETLLAWTEAARYLGYDGLKPLVLQEANAGYRRNVSQALADDPDSTTTKGYYQWASMAYAELAQWSFSAGQPRHAERLLHLADWMIDVHKTLARTRNTAYAYEGLVMAWAVANQRGERARADKLACVIDEGLYKLSGWQVGGPLPNAFISETAVADRHARGGIQNHAVESLLRIDVTQHQMHALLLYQQYIHRRP